ncbi:hypothetical protein [Actinoplanes regularis]|uniref:Uncharacterized protein n=1 Tax=Actinoplanes regularis TaxID=52697 RepID=A0A239IBX0_9ACTN|nr:hypothetical protein [Actinoplanes regularis]GIE90761.1 hypothetical protein Are01nite_72410 [Actinoplanes regularis]SNS91019.1 hypothetical protein SAMN06264365_12840 [Actinoplanes regularis]
MADDSSFSSAQGDLPTFAWDSEAAIRFEVAVEAISQAVAAYTALIERANAAGDSSRAQELAGQRSACVQAREALNSEDTDAVSEAIRTYRQVTEDLRAQDR